MELKSDKARYNPSEPVTLTIDLDPSRKITQTQTLKVVFKHLENQVDEQTMELSSGQDHLEIQWLSPSEDFKGYLIEVSLIEKSTILDQRNIAVDVSSSWARFPRYGYLADFSQKTPSEINTIVDHLNRYHLNGFLFYDWQAQHDQPLPLDPVGEDGFWLNIANEKVYFSTVKGYIEALHQRNMMASNYNLVYGAYEAYALAHPEQGLYKDTKQTTQDKHDLPESWASDLYLINPDDLAWQDHYIQMENAVLSQLSFDVMHLDTLGSRGTLYSASGSFVDVPLAFTHFIQNVKTKLNQEFLFNFVNEYGKFQVASSDLVSFAYSELWPDQYPTYASLNGAIRKDTQLGLASVLALYMNYPVKSGNFNTPAVLLTEAVVLASGGDRLSLGDLGMLSSEYYPNDKLKMSEDLKRKMTDYADFMVAYENVLRDDLIESSDIATLTGIKSGNTLTPKSIWLYSKENSQYKTVHLINLMSRSDLLWRDDRGTVEEPIIQTNLKLQIPSAMPVKALYAASPDSHGGSLQALDFTYDQGVINVTVDRLEVWTMILIVK